MKYIDDYSDSRFKGVCAQCGLHIGEHNKSSDHVPTKCLLHQSEGPDKDGFPENLPVISTCRDCNQRVASDEEYFCLFLRCVLTGSADPEDHAEPSVRRSLRRNTGLRARIEASKKLVHHDGDSVLIWMPELERIRRVVIKNARGHAFYEFGQPALGEPEYVWAGPLSEMTHAQRQQFETGPSGLVGWPEVGSRMMTRVVTGLDLRDGWIIVQPEVYRYRVEEEEGVVVRTVLSEYLATETHWSSSMT